MSMTLLQKHAEDSVHSQRGSIYASYKSSAACMLCLADTQQPSLPTSHAPHPEQAVMVFHAGPADLSNIRKLGNCQQTSL